MLLPVYIGFRYGFLSGCVAGIVTAAVAGVVVAGKGDDLSVAEALLNHRLLLLGFFIGGILTGAVRSLLNGQLRSLEARATSAEAENKSLRSDNETLDETRHQLQQRLALFGADTCALDQQLRALFAPTAGPVLPGCLKLLRDAANVSSCCVLELGSDDGTGKVIAALDSQWKVGDTLPQEKLAMARAALKAQSTVTWKAGSSTGDTDFIAAVPWNSDAGSKVVLHVEDMPFSVIGQPTFVRIEVIVRWVARFLPEPAPGAAMEAEKGRAAASHFVTTEEFESQGKLAQETFARLRLPSTVVEFEVNHDQGKSTGIESLTAAIKQQLVAPRVVCADAKSNTLRMLLPMEGRRDAESFVASLQASGAMQPDRIRHQIIEIGANDSNTVAEAK
ncbi:MAG: hypothetical protein O3C21_09930 [Verrucomicrobia bacterium]|nr:hypothetical protein [Verrucomicrobiota bacterium]